MTHGLRARVRAGIVAADVDLPATTVAVVGPNAAGKTTLLKAVAGLVDNPGPVTIDGVDVTATPASRRRVGYVPQQVALFPHLSVLDNVAYGVRLSARSVGRTKGRQVAQRWLDEMELAGLAGRLPRSLSGGQAQRVALARALATQPAVLLLDEPLASLDPAARWEVRRTLRTRLRDFAGTALVVSHDLTDVWALADWVLVMESGRVVQSATPHDLATRPGSVWAAVMTGHNAWPGTPDPTTATLGVAPGLALHCAGDVSRAVGARVLPHALQLGPPGSNTDPRNAWAALVETVEPRGDRLLVRVEGPVDATVELLTTAAGTWLTEGATVSVQVPAEAVHPIDETATATLTEQRTVPPRGSVEEES